MKGWKTWLAVAGMFFLGIVDICDGQVEGGIVKITGALGLLGIGHKVEKKQKTEDRGQRTEDRRQKIEDDEVAI